MAKHKQSSNYRAWLICSLGVLFYGYEYLLRVTPSVMSAQLRSTFHIDAAMLGTLSAFYYFAYTPMQIPVGLGLDWFGPRRILTFAAMVCGVGSFLFANTYLGVSELGRFLVGLGSAFAFVGALRLGSIWLPEKQFALFSGLTMTVGMLGAIFGEVVMSWLTTILGWRETIHVSAVFGLVLGVLIFLIVRDEQHTNKQRRHKKRTIDVTRDWRGIKSLFLTREFWVIGCVGMLGYLPMSAFAELWAPTYVEMVYHVSKDVAGYADSMFFLGAAVGAPVMGWLAGYLGRRVLVLRYGILGGAIGLGIILWLPDYSLVLVFLLLFITGFLSSAQILVFVMAREISPKKIIATTIALINMMVMTSGMLFQPIVGALIDMFSVGERVTGETPLNLTGMREGMIILPICVLLCFFVTFLLKETARKRQ